MALTNYDYTSQLNQMKEAQKNAAIADLQKAKNQAYSDLEAEQAKNTANYNTQRNTANIQNRLSAKNFQEYLANTGRANSGLSAQARLQNSNNLNTSLNSIRGAENATNADIYRRRTDADNAYSSGLASANANIESNYIQNLLNERQKQFEREQAIANQEMQERQFQESIRQFNENLALQRQQMQSSFSRGSGGGSSYRKNNSSNDVVTEYYQGKYNKDATNGTSTFSNGYQPDNVNGHKLKKTGNTITFNTRNLNGEGKTVTQNIWKTTVKGETKYYYWDGRRNSYLECDKKGNIK